MIQLLVLYFGMIQEASFEDIAALTGNENESEAEETGNGTMDEANFSNRETPEPEDGFAALRAARNSSSENASPDIADELPSE